MPIFFENKVILAKIETTYGTDSTPTGAANAILTRNFSITPLEGTELVRNLDTPTFGAQPFALVGKHVLFDFEVELAGAGAVDTAPPYGPLLRAIAFAETITAATDVQYDFVSGGFESVTFAFNLDGIEHRAVGVRGSADLDFTSGQYPFLKFKMIGLFLPPTEVAIPTPDFTGFKNPTEVSNATTPTLTLHGFAAVMRSLKLDFGGDVKHRDLVGSESVIYSGREMKGTILIEAPTLTAKNYFTTVTGHTLGALQLIHGSSAGEIIQLDAPKVQLGKPSYNNEDKIAMLSIPLTLTAETGDDEFKLTTK